MIEWTGVLGHRCAGVRATAVTAAAAAAAAVQVGAGGRCSCGINIFTAAATTAAPAWDVA